MYLFEQLESARDVAEIRQVSLGYNSRNAANGEEEGERDDQAPLLAAESSPSCMKMIGEEEVDSKAAEDDKRYAGARCREPKGG